MVWLPAAAAAGLGCEVRQALASVLAWLPWHWTERQTVTLCRFSSQRLLKKYAKKEQH